AQRKRMQLISAAERRGRSFRRGEIPRERAARGFSARRHPTARLLRRVTDTTRYPGTLPATWLSARTAVDPARIDALRRAGELIAVRDPGSTEWRYPAGRVAAGKRRQ